MTIAGAMSTAELGLSLAEIIRQDKVHGICTTGANLEEDIFNLVAHNHYVRVPNYRNLSDAEEVALRERGMNRVTDTCIPEEEAMRRIERQVLKLWQKADSEKQRLLSVRIHVPVDSRCYIKEYFEIDPKDSWLVAASEKNLPIFTPGWEDSTLGNIFVANVMRGRRFKFSSREVRRGANGRADRMVSQEFGQRIDRLLSDRGRNRRRLSDLRCPADHAGPSREMPALGLLLPDFRQHHVVRILQWRGAERKNHLGKTGGVHAAIRHRVRRLDCRPADVCLYPRAIRSEHTNGKSRRRSHFCGKRRNYSKLTAP